MFPGPMVPNPIFADVQTARSSAHLVPAGPASGAFGPVTQAVLGPHPQIDTAVSDAPTRYPHEFWTTAALAIVLERPLG
jgi:hypothetical protein